MKLTNYIFQMNSLDKEIIKFDDKIPIRAYPKIGMSDSILSFYPSAQVYIRDKVGAIFESILYIEGLKLQTKLGRDVESSNNKDLFGGHFINNWVWAKGDINQTEIKKHMAGDFIFSLAPELFMNDATSTTAYYDTISNIVKKVVTDVKGLNFKEAKTSDSTNLQIGQTTTNKSVWYQSGRLGRFFLEALSTRAVSQNYSNSPYYTFLNLKNEFYFMSLSELLSQNVDKSANYIIDETLDSIQNPNVIKSYTFHTAGLGITKDNYNVKNYKISNTGIVSSENSLLSSYKQKVNGAKGLTSDKDKFLILKNLVQSNKIESIQNYGISDSDDVECYQGWKNSFFIDSVLPYRMEIVTSLNPNLCSGKVLTIQIQKTTDNTLATEFSGKWLIIDSEIHLDLEGMPSQRFLIGKPGIAIDSSNPLSSDYI